MDKADSMKETQTIYQELQELHDLNMLEEAIKDNKLEFDHNENKYRVRLLNSSEKQELNNLRMRKFGQLIKDKDILLEKDLVEQYKKRGINIDDIDKKISILEKAFQDKENKLGEAISKKRAEQILKDFENEIKDLKKEIQLLSIQRHTLLIYSLENILRDFVAEAITYLSLEKDENGEWIKAFQSLEDFQNYNDDILKQKAAYKSLLIQYKV